MSLHPDDFLMIASSNSASSSPLFSSPLFLNFLLQLRTQNKTLLSFVHATRFLTPTIFFTYVVIMISDPKLSGGPVGTNRPESRAPGCVSSCRARESIL